MLQGLNRDQRGVASIEFAFIAPVLVLVYLGMAELSEAMMAQRRVSHVAAVLGDLVSQGQTTTSGQITDILNIRQSLLSPLPSTNLKVRLSSVTVNTSNVPIVDWSKASGLTAHAKGAAITLPKSPSNASMPFIAAGQSVILAEVEYPWTPPTGDFIKVSKNLTETAYFLPRQGTTITCSDC
jgi:Flp pilus assembly protein TadG